MTKFFALIIFAFAVPAVSHAGSSGCSNSQEYTTPNTDVSVRLSDCLLIANSSSFGYIRFNLPSNPSLGDEFTFTNNGATQTDEFGTYTGGMGVEAPVGISIDGYQEYWVDYPGWHVKMSWDGSKYTVLDEGPAQ
jgi:hypothetical protein